MVRLCPRLLPTIPRVTAQTQSLGALGELVAERYLRGKGWRVLNRRFRSGHRDLDLVVEQNGIVAFVEVKTRSGMLFGSPVQAVNWAKQRELRRSAMIWIDRHGRDEEVYRFDVIGILVSQDGVRVRHVENAFSLESRV